MTNLAKRDNGMWRARYRDAAGKQHARHFVRKADAQRWLDEVTTAVVTGQYVDPHAGRVTFGVYAEQWRLIQVHRQSTALHVETMLRRHAYPTFGDRTLVSIMPSEIQAWVKMLGTPDLAAGRRGLTPHSINVIHSIASSIMRSAVRDRKIVSNPCDGTKLPKIEKRRTLPVTTAQVEALRAAAPDDLKALITFTAGTGLRQGEVFGVTRDRLRLLGVNPVVVVDRQLITQRGAPPTFGPLKTSASYRTVPLARAVVAALNDHLATRDVGDEDLVFTRAGDPWSRQLFGHAWRPLAKSAGLTQATGTGMHALRHYYASLLIRFGESVKTVQVRLGHASASETLDTYSHLWPDSDDRTRDAIDAVLGVGRREEATS